MGLVGRGGGDEGEGANALTASAKLLREEVVSLLRSSNFSFIAATTGATSTAGAGGVGSVGGVVWATSLISVQMPWRSLRMLSSKREAGVEWARSARLMASTGPIVTVQITLISDPDTRIDGA